MQDKATSSVEDPVQCLLRVPEVFEPWKADLLRDLGAERVRRLGKEFELVRIKLAAPLASSVAAKYVSWILPLQHVWPCQPKTMDGFIEKAAQALARKFASTDLQALMIGALDPGGDRYYRGLASNLRGRALQLFDQPLREMHDAESQDPQRPTLYVLVGPEGLFAGVQSPAKAGGFHPGGIKFIRQNSADTISRAGAKIAEALHHLPLHASCPSAGAHWLELGASPGGMTAELLRRGYLVTAIDRAALDARLLGAPGLQVVQADVADFEPASGIRYDAILSDMNGDALLAFSRVGRLVRHLKPSGLVVFTLKLAGVETYDGINLLEQKLRLAVELAGLKWLVCRHLTYNRMEFTCILQRSH